MAFMKKDVLIEEAQRYGIDLDGKTWSEQNQLVRAAIEADGKRVDRSGNVVEDTTDTKVDTNDFTAYRDELVKEIEALEAKKQQLTNATKQPVKPEQPHDQPIPKGRVFMAPEIRATGVQLLKYDEELGDDITVEEISYKDAMAKGARVERDMNLGTYKIKGKTGRKVIAQSTVPKENAGVSYDPEKDLVPVVTYAGKTGYIWTHQHYPNIKELLKESGLYHKYKHLFSSTEHPENIWYAAGKMLVVDIDVTHAVFHEIEGDYRAGRY